MSLHTHADITPLRTRPPWARYWKAQGHMVNAAAFLVCFGNCQSTSATKGSSSQVDMNFKEANIKLIYFNLRGRGELIRMVMYAGNKEFEDSRVKTEQWPAIKSQMPFGQLPVLEVTPRGGGNKVTYTESMAIARMLARELDLYGSSPKEIYLIERVNSVTAALQDEIYHLGLKKADDVTRLVDMDHLNEYFETIEDLLKAKKTKYIAGANMTMADIQVINLLDTMNAYLAKQNPACKPQLEQIKADVLSERPKLASYLRTRAKTDF